MKCLVVMFISLVCFGAFGAPSAKELCIADENTVWVESNRVCIPKNPCELPNSEYCSLYQPKNITQKEILTALIKLYAKVRYNINDCKLTRVGEVYFACASNDNYIVFISGEDIQENADQNLENNVEQKSIKSTITVTNLNEKLVKNELHNALLEVCKILGGRPDEELSKATEKDSNYGVTGSCIRVLDSRCELIGATSTYEFGQKVCMLHDIKDILNVKIEKKD